MGRPRRTENTKQNRRQVLLTPEVDAMLMILCEHSGRTIKAEIERMIIEEYYRHFEEMEETYL